MSDFGGKWPLKWIFSKMAFGIHRWDSELRFVTKFGENLPLWSSQKVAWFTKQKNSGSVGLIPAPFWPKWGDRAQNSLNVVTPWPVHVYRIWSGSAAFCRTYWFFGPKSQYNIGFQPKNYMTLHTGWVKKNQTVFEIRYGNFATIEDRKACNMSKVSEFCLEWSA